MGFWHGWLWNMESEAVSPQLFPALLVILNLGAAVGNWQDWRKVVFFASAAAINYVMAW